MLLAQDWKNMYTASDSFRSPYSKADLTYLITKYGRAKNGAAPTRESLRRLPLKMLWVMWSQIRPFDFGKPVEVTQNADN